MAAPASIADYLRMYGSALGEHVLARFPALHSPDDPVWPALKQLKRRPFPAQAMAIMGIVKCWQEARCAAAVAECGTGKTLISLGSVFTHASATAVHLSRDGAASACREMVQRGGLDASGRPSVRHRRMPERSGIEWIHGRE